jgi:hypothetical protein
LIAPALPLIGPTVVLAFALALTVVLVGADSGRPRIDAGSMISPRMSTFVWRLGS